MTELILKKLTLKNFKAFKNKTFEFTKETNIFGANQAGKTSIFIAILWLLFGKDNLGRSDFGMKPFDAKGNTIPKLETGVEGEFLINGVKTTLKRVLVEKWQKPKGEPKAVFKGNETKYFWNSVPKKQNEYQKNINDLLSEDIFKLITDPLAFSNINWKDARSILTTIVGDVSDTDIAKTKTEFQELLNKLQGKELKEYQAQLKSEITDLKKEIQQIPTRIDEVYNNKPEPINEAELTQEKQGLEKDIETLEETVQNTNKAHEAELKKQQEINTQISQLQTNVNTVINNIKNSITDSSVDLESELTRLNSRRDSFESSLKTYKYTFDKNANEIKANDEEIQNCITQIDAKRNEWQKENKSELKFDENSFACPTCERKLEATDIEIQKQLMLHDFNTDKTVTLQTLQKQANGFNKTKIALEERNVVLKEENDKLIKTMAEQKKQLDEVLAKITQTEEAIKNQPDFDTLLKEELAKSKELKKINEEIKTLKMLLHNRPHFDVSEIKTQIKEKQESLEKVKDQLKITEQITKADKRIEELQQQENVLAQQIVDREKEQFVADAFEIAKIEALESKINKCFTQVRFKMFNTLVNGGTEPTCIPLINGVPFKDANTAGQINAGIDIISTLSDFYKVKVPIIIDNRESVTEIIKTKSQVINLIVSPEHKQLTFK